MKLRTLISIILFMSGSHALMADETSATPPVGYFKLNARGASDSILSVPLVRRSAGLARASGVGTDTVTLSLQGLVDDAFASSSSGSYYLQFITGHLAGLYYKITGNVGSVIKLDTLGDDLTAHALGLVATGASGDLVRVCPFWTVRDLFGADESSLSIATTTNAAGMHYIDGDEILFFDNAALGTEKTPVSALGYVSGTGWRARGGATDVGVQEVRPSEAFVVRRQSVTPIQVAVIGSVPLVPLVIRLGSISEGQEMDVAIGLAHPAERKLAEAQLFSTTTTSVINAATDAMNLDDLLLDYSTNRQGFSLPPDARFYVTGNEWYQGSTLADDYLLVPGVGYVLRMRGVHAVRYWVQTPSY